MKDEAETHDARVALPGPGGSGGHTVVGAAWPRRRFLATGAIGAAAALLPGPRARAARAEDEARELFGPRNDFGGGALRRTGVESRIEEGRLRLDAAAWSAGGERRRVTFPLPAAGRDLARFRYVAAEIANRGTAPVQFTFWAQSERGWGGVSTFPATLEPSGRETLAPGERRTFRIDLHARYSGPTAYTKAINPAEVRRLDLVFEQDRVPVAVELGPIRAVGRGPAEPHDTSRRVIVPDIAEGPPAPGRRVRHRLPGGDGTGPAHILTLPREWEPGRRWPVLVEYTGNVFYHKFCHSSGWTEQGNLAYGLSRGEGFLLLNLPFVSPDGRREQVDGFGDLDRTATYCLEALAYLEKHYGADRRAVFFTGFSRGSYAANALALRDDGIAAVWAGFLTLRHPGEPWPAAAGKGWRGVDVKWNERAARLGRAGWFHRPDELGPEVHVDGEFLEDRPSTVATRAWLAEQVARRQAEAP